MAATPDSSRACNAALREIMSFCGSGTCWFNAARRQVDKAEPAVRLYDADYMPQVMAYGMYTDQSTSPLIQHDFTDVGVSASSTTRDVCLRQYATRIGSSTT